MAAAAAPPSAPDTATSLGSPSAPARDPAELAAGICSYLSTHPGFTAILKQRFSGARRRDAAPPAASVAAGAGGMTVHASHVAPADFHVREVSESGEVAHLTSLTAPTHLLAAAQARVAPCGDTCHAPNARL